MSTLPDKCRLVQSYATAWLDHGLDSRRHEAIERHLARCATCQACYLDLRELRVRLRSAVPPPLPAGFAARVRKGSLAASHRPAWYRHPALLRSAAGLLVLLTITAAYLVGRRHGAEPGREPLSPQAEPLHLIRTADLGEGLRAARSLVADLGIIDQIPADLRQPLVRAQMADFRLGDWASAVQEQRAGGEMARLASFVREVDRNLEATGGPEMLALRDRALDASIWERSALHPIEDQGPTDSDSRSLRRAEIIGAVAAGLPSEARMALERILTLKEALVAGDYRSAVMLGQDVPAGSDLRPALAVNLVFAYGEAGLDELAAPWLTPLATDAPDLIARLLPAVFGGRDPLATAPDDREIRTAALQEKLSRLFNGADGEGGVTVEEHVGESGMRYRLIIRASSTRVRRKAPEDLGDP